MAVSKHDLKPSGACFFENLHAALDSQVPFLLDFCPRRATKARSLQCSTFHIIYLFNHLSTCHKNHHFTFKTTFLITFRNVIKTIIDNYLLKTSYVYYIFYNIINHMFYFLFQPMSTHQADMSTKIRFVKTDDAFIINYNTK